MTASNLAALIDTIDNRADSDFDCGRTNHLTDLACFIVAVLASFAASILAGAEACAWLTALVAALPGACIALQRAVDFRGRAAWYFLKAARLNGISLRLKHESLAVEDGSKEYRKTEEDMERQWSQYVKSGQVSTDPHNSQDSTG